ncbi:hypothetical protein BH11PSE2_BH11PSE2_08860 [soil metagenome]
MRGGALPPALLCAALGFALAVAPRRAMLAGIVALVAVAAVIAQIAIPQAWLEATFLGCWLSAIVTAATVHLPKDRHLVLPLLLAVNAGVWSGAVVAVAGEPLDLAKALPAVLIALPAAWLVHTNRTIVIKVVASWLIAVSVLAAALPLTPTPGYKPDHME